MSNDVFKRAARMIKELLKHAQKDNCYECKTILKEMGIDANKSYEDLVKQAKEMYP